MIARRIRRILAALTGRTLTRIEVDQADAMVELERERLQEHVARYNEGLAVHAGACERWRSRIAHLEREVERVGRQAVQHLAAGDRQSAAKSALEEERLGAELARTQAELQEGEATYQELVRVRRVAVESARVRIEALRRTIDTTRARTALAALTEMAAGLQGVLGGAGGDVERLNARMEERSAHAIGRARVARELLVSAGCSWEEATAEDADNALARLETRLAATPRLA